MELKRVKEIAASPIMVNVTYNGVPVYIESLAGDNATAYVHSLNQPNNLQKVNITNLIEH